MYQLLQLQLNFPQNQFVYSADKKVKNVSISSPVYSLSHYQDKQEAEGDLLYEFASWSKCRAGPSEEDWDTDQTHH